MDCREADELLGAHALNALDASEREEVEAHLATCELHAETLAFELTAARLAAVATERDAPATLRQRVLSIPAESSKAPRALNALPAGGRPVARGGPARRAWWSDLRVAYGVAAAFAVIALGLGAWGLALRTDDGGPAVVRTTAANGVSSRLVYLDDQGLGMLSIEGLSALPSGQDYQLWRIPPGGPPIDQGVILLEGDAGSPFPIVGVLEAGTTFAVTVEPAGGSEQPTSPPIISTTF